MWACLSPLRRRRFVAADRCYFAVAVPADQDHVRDRKDDAYEDGDPVAVVQLRLDAKGYSIGHRSVRTEDLRADICTSNCRPAGEGHQSQEQHNAEVRGALRFGASLFALGKARRTRIAHKPEPFEDRSEAKERHSVRGRTIICLRSVYLRLVPTGLIVSKLLMKLVGREGIEPSTNGLRVRGCVNTHRFLELYQPLFPSASGIH